MNEDIGRLTGFGGFIRRALAIAAIFLVVFGLVILFWFTSYVWFALLIGILLALFLRTLSDQVERRLKIKHPWALILVLIVGSGLLVLACWVLITPISEQFQQLHRRLPEALNHAWHRVQVSPLKKYLPTQTPSSEDMVTLSKSLLPKLASLFKITLTAVAGTLVAFFMGLYMAFDPETYAGGLVRLVPVSQRPRSRAILRETGNTLSRWIFGQLISMFCVGTLIGFGLYFSGIPLSLALGVIAGALDIVPVAGPILASIPAILLGFAVGPWHALFAVVVFVGANQIEGNVLLPVIHRYAVWLPPALTLFALTIMATLFGILGALLATPITAIALILVKRLYLEVTLGDFNSAGASNEDADKCANSQDSELSSAA